MSAVPVTQFDDPPNVTARLGNRPGFFVKDATMALGAMGVVSRGGFGSAGALGGAVNPDLPTAPVLAMDPAWVTTDATPDFIADVDDTVAAGDDTRLQIQAALGDWSVLLSNTTHEITAPEDAANEISQGNGSLANGDYEARMNVTRDSDGLTSNWSNTVSFTVAAVTNLRISSTGNTRISSAGNNRIHT